MRVLLLTSSFALATVGAGAISAQSSAAPTSVATPRVSSSGVRIVPRAIKKPASFDAGFFDSL